MITLRKADERGYAHHGWLESGHSFSFTDYRDPAHARFGPLRVVNEDIVQPGTGFGTHGASRYGNPDLCIERYIAPPRQHGKQRRHPIRRSTGNERGHGRAAQ